MENLKNKARETSKRKTRSIRTWQTVLACALLAALFALPPSMGTLVALADHGGSPGHNFDVTFTKWVTTAPAMEGIVGGHVGAGTFAGEILVFVPGSDITTIEARYHINGGTHSLSAHVYVTQNETTQTATLTGEVTQGWHNGKHVRGNYTVISCPDRTNGVCYQGTLHIFAGSERGR